MGPEKSEKPHGENSTQKRESPSLRYMPVIKLELK